MFEQLLHAAVTGDGGDGGLLPELDAYDEAFARLVDVDLDALDRDLLLAVACRFEAHRRREAVFDHRLVAQLESRGVAGELGFASSTALLSQMVRINPGHAKARVRAAAALGPRRGLVGQPLEPEFTRVAAAQSDGSISVEHARVITHTVLNDLPAAIRDTHRDTVENDLVELAHEFTPAQLGVLARHMVVVLNPDGTLADDEDHRRRRDLTLAQHADGSGTLRGRLSPATVAALQAVLDSTARPLPAEDGTPDPRNPGQRRHDGLHDALLLALRCGELPEVGGTPVTLVITMTADQLADHINSDSTDCDHTESRPCYGSTAYAATHTTTPDSSRDHDCPTSHARDGRGHDETDETDETDADGTDSSDTTAEVTLPRHPRSDGGYARTNHGGLIPVADALALADQADIITVLFNHLGGVMAYGRDRRCPDPPMRRVLAARDKGCSFPGCTAPPGWTQAHHVIEWAQGGKTDIRNLTLVCGFHHRHHKRLGWTCHMRDGLPYWTPPRWLDKSQTPRLNKAHL